MGAGLSVFCGCKLRPSVLKELSEFIPDEGPKRESLEIIVQSKYLEAAEHIQKHYRPMPQRLLWIVSYDKCDACPDERLYSSASWVLPYLFHNLPLMTTNFDDVLEYVFSKWCSAFEQVVEPHDPSLRQRNIHGLFKLHGDISKETTSLDRRILARRAGLGAHFCAVPVAQPVPVAGFAVASPNFAGAVGDGIRPMLIEHLRRLLKKSRCFKNTELRLLDRFRATSDCADNIPHLSTIRKVHT